MARIFLSHSSVNVAEGLAICRWLAEEGWDDVFFDLDPERGIKAGELRGRLLLADYEALGRIKGSSCLKGWALTPTILSDRRQMRPPLNCRESGFVQSQIDSFNQ